MKEKEAGKVLTGPRAPLPFPSLKCPRCESGNTKFSYYNNHKISQPRYQCKDCHRYWTHGGILRNIPRGGNRRKRASKKFAPSSSKIPKQPPTCLSIVSSLNHASAGSSDDAGTYKPENLQSQHSFNGGDLFYQPPFTVNPSYEFVGVNASFGEVNVAFGVGATTAQPTPLNTLGEIGMPFVQQPLQQQPPTEKASQNIEHTSTSHGDFKANDQEVTAAADVLIIDEWIEFEDVYLEIDPLQSYKPPSP